MSFPALPRSDENSDGDADAQSRPTPSAVPGSRSIAEQLAAVPPLPPRPAGEPLSATAPGPVPAEATTPPLVRGAVRIGRFAGTEVFVHWTWFAAAYFLLRDRPVVYSSFAWDVAEYVAGFGIVLLHEFGHVLACRQVGGTADRVVLWPLGGLAFVSPPLRPGAALWTTVAGPLVNLALVPVFLLLLAVTAPADDLSGDDLHGVIWALTVFNGTMLVFNLVPIYPLDGGRILQEGLWFWVGRVPSLRVAAGLGVVLGAGLALYAVMDQQWWLAALAAFLVLGSVSGITYARLLSRLRHASRHAGLACPGCGAAPPVGEYRRCRHCQAAFDLFAPAGHCPQNGCHSSETSCLECSRHIAAGDWRTTPPADPLAADRSTGDGRRPAGGSGLTT